MGGLKIRVLCSLCFTLNYGLTITRFIGASNGESTITFNTSSCNKLAFNASLVITQTFS